MKTYIIGALIFMGIFMITSASAGVGSIPVHGEHYNLNIIGMEKHGIVGDSDGHTMFVKLDGKTKIIMTQDANGSFKVTDRNGLDGEASFNIAPRYYNIFAAGLGKPGGKTYIDAYGNFTDALTGSTIIPLGFVDLTRDKGRPQSVNINSLFYVDVSLCQVMVNGTCTQTVNYNDYWVFGIGELIGYYWDYNNLGLRLLQVRLYPCTLDATGTAPDFCMNADGSPINSTKEVVIAA